MNVLIFNGAIESTGDSASAKISEILRHELAAKGANVVQYNITDSGIPIFELNPTVIPEPVQTMGALFRSSDLQIWLTPLYHGSMTGAMKNCLDWLEYNVERPNTYLDGKIVGFVCWAGGMNATNGINTMDTVAKALRAWTIPFNVPMQYKDLFDESGNISVHYHEKLKMLTTLLVNAPILNRN